jgi:hypothetical protein
MITTGNRIMNLQAVVHTNIAYLDAAKWIMLDSLHLSCTRESRSVLSMAVCIDLGNLRLELGYQVVMMESDFPTLTSLWWQLWCLHPTFYTFSSYKVKMLYPLAIFFWF